MYRNYIQKQNQRHSFKYLIQSLCFLTIFKFFGTPEVQLYLMSKDCQSYEMINDEKDQMCKNCALYNPTFGSVPDAPPRLSLLDLSIFREASQDINVIDFL